MGVYTKVNINGNSPLLSTALTIFHVKALLPRRKLIKMKSDKLSTHKIYVSQIQSDERLVILVHLLTSPLRIKRKKDNEVDV